FINGKSQGRREKNDSTYQARYRLMWNNVVYEPGEAMVVAYDADGTPADTVVTRTAGKPHHLVITPASRVGKAGDEELIYFTVTAADKNGNLVPRDSRRVKFTVEGEGVFEATANGDPTCILPFQKPEMDLFSGAATAIVRSNGKPGDITIKASAHGVKPAKTTVTLH
ncbi:MAG: DUF4982 domain-containing protein, partial [Candidatus Amulumruptor sp.]|nr:DUF4982 domain-containing protein [Candidatus Amulumruptor sp.]